MTREAGPRIGVVGLEGSWSTEALADALWARTGHRIVVDMARVEMDVCSGRLRMGGLALDALDGLVIKKLGKRYGPELLQRLDMLSELAARGLPILSHPERIGRMLDRQRCTLELARAGLPMPETVITEDVSAAAAAIRRFGRAVLKPLYSTKAEGMMVLSADGDALERRLADHRPAHQAVFYIQEHLELLEGRDFGSVFLGGEHLGTYSRVGHPDSWNTTIRDGGHYERHELAPDLVALAHRAQALFGLDFTSVDLALTPKGPVIFEVSAFGGFRGLRDGLGVDAAARVADYAVGRIAGPGAS